MQPWSQYLLSLPERVVRSTSALAAGLVREIGNVTLPLAVRRTRLYQTMVDTTLRFLIEQVGEVEGAYPREGQLAENFLLQRTVGDGIDFAGLLAFHASPVWVLAALADISGPGRQLIDEIHRTFDGVVIGDAQHVDPRIGNRSRDLVGCCRRIAAPHRVAVHVDSHPTRRQRFSEMWMTSDG